MSESCFYFGISSFKHKCFFINSVRKFDMSNPLAVLMLFSSSEDEDDNALVVQRRELRQQINVFALPDRK